MLVGMVYKVGEKCHNRMLDIVMKYKPNPLDTKKTHLTHL